MTDHVLVADDGPVRTVRMNRPDKKNALTAAMYDAMASALEDAAARADTRAVLIAGVPGAFSAGNDIADFLSFAETGRGLSPAILRFLEAIARAEKPLVAAVDGVAVGLGTTLLLHCDHVVASTRAVFRTPFLDLGLIPEAASTLLAPRLMGHQEAMRLLCLGEPYDAATAQAAGFVTRVVSPDEVEAAGRAGALALANKPPRALAAARRLMRGDPAEIVARLHEEARVFAQLLGSDEARRAFAAFLARK